jgi:hypothetical protein
VSQLSREYHIPGLSANNVVDATSTIGKIYQNQQYFLEQYAGIPDTTVMVNPQSWSVFKDTVGGGVYIAANDGGTIKKTELNGVGKLATSNLIFYVATTGNDTNAGT